jgi:hypothetical protein
MFSLAWCVSPDGNVLLTFRSWHKLRGIAWEQYRTSPTYMLRPSWSLIIMCSFLLFSNHGDPCPNQWLNAPCSGVKSHPERWKDEEYWYWYNLDDGITWINIGFLPALDFVLSSKCARAISSEAPTKVRQFLRRKWPKANSARLARAGPEKRRQRWLLPLTPFFRWMWMMWTVGKMLSIFMDICAGTGT